MHTVNMFEAKSTLSRLVETIELGREPEIIIARNGRPAARLVPIGVPQIVKRIGVAKGLFEVPYDIDQHNAEIAQLFLTRSSRMRLLLDTHIALWAIADSAQLSLQARVLIEAPSTSVWVSAVAAGANMQRFSRSGNTDGFLAASTVFPAHPGLSRGPL